MSHSSSFLPIITATARNPQLPSARTSKAESIKLCKKRGNDSRSEMDLEGESFEIDSDFKFNEIELDGRSSEQVIFLSTIEDIFSIDATMDSAFISENENKKE